MRQELKDFPSTLHCKYLKIKPETRHIPTHLRAKETICHSTLFIEQTIRLTQMEKSQIVLKQGYR